jgi:GT2 family glycosyltransferase
MPKIMIVMPTRGRPWCATLGYAMKLAETLHTSCLLNTGAPLTMARNYFVKNFLKNPEYTHLYMLDDDVVPPPDALDRLLAINAPVATAVYPLFTTKPVMSAMSMTDSEWPRKVVFKPFQARHAGLGCMLVERRVFETVKFPWFYFDEREDQPFVGEDVWFCFKVREAGFDIVCDGRIICGHVKDNVNLSQLIS